MIVTPVRSRASFVLSVIALVQLALLGSALGLLLLKLREVRANLTRAGQEEQSFLNELAAAQSDLYRSSILLRDDIILSGQEQEHAQQELVNLLTRIEGQPLRGPDWIPRGMRDRLESVEADRREYLVRARTITAWGDKERSTLGPQYLARQMAPTRERFLGTAREISTLVQSLREARNRNMAISIANIQSLLVRIVLIAAGFGLALAAAAIWRFRHYESERDQHVQHLREAQDRLRTLSQRLVESQEQERKNLSRELHDEVGQILTALRVQIGQVEPAGESSAGHLHLASDLAERSLRSVREMARGLRPAMLDDLGLAAALNWLGRDFSKHTALDVQLEIDGDVSGLDESRRTCLYRVAQEALNNCVKHSGSTTARVRLHQNLRELVLTVQDDGSGFAKSRTGGVGLLGMRERVEELGGQFSVNSVPGTGTLVRVTLPKKETTGNDTNSDSR